MAGSVQSVVWWLSMKAQVNTCYPPDSGRTPLHYAVRENHAHVFAFLLLNGSDIYAEDVEGKAVVALVEEYGNESMKEMISCVQKGYY